jgi:hypothetical protein
MSLPHPNAVLPLQMAQLLSSLSDSRTVRRLLIIEDRRAPCQI